VPTTLLAYRPAPVAASPLVRRADVGPLTWTGMHLDGLLEPLWGDVAVLTGVTVTAELRLAALAPLVPVRGVVGRATAAWVHAGGAAPAKVDVLVRPHARRTDPHLSRRACEAPLPVHEVLVLGGRRVTTVQRTGLDVARFVAGAEARGLVVRLLACGFDPAAALVELDRMPGERSIRSARALLAAL